MNVGGDDMPKSEVPQHTTFLDWVSAQTALRSTPERATWTTGSVIVGTVVVGVSVPQQKTWSSSVIAHADVYPTETAFTEETEEAPDTMP